jgi:hypothetical protein
MILFSSRPLISKTTKLHSLFFLERSIINERTIQYLKDMAENFGDYISSRKEKLQTNALNTMDESFCRSLQQENNILTLQNLLFTMIISFVYI